MRNMVTEVVADAVSSSGDEFSHGELGTEFVANMGRKWKRGCGPKWDVLLRLWRFERWCTGAEEEEDEGIKRERERYEKRWIDFRERPERPIGGSKGGAYKKLL